MPRRNYMTELAINLIRPWAEHRLTFQQTPVEEIIRNVFSIPKPAPTRDGNKPLMGECTSSRKRCELCKPCNDKRHDTVATNVIRQQTVLLGPRRMCSITMKPLNPYLRL
ncbi:hypothetical protein Avbf_18332 [Armadillidium vulgare]|nr:hypothetical protein Avbf_18332 [Armadillidium vulgare]